MFIFPSPSPAQPELQMCLGTAKDLHVPPAGEKAPSLPQLCAVLNGVRVPICLTQATLSPWQWAEEKDTVLTA